MTSPARSRMVRCFITAKRETGRPRGVGEPPAASQTSGMRVVADVPLHSKSSRATSRDMDVENLARWCKLKGITLVGTGDFTHPVWFREMRAKLKPTGRGLFTYDGMHFLLTVEVSNIYPQGGRLRKI